MSAAKSKLEALLRDITKVEDQIKKLESDEVKKKSEVENAGKKVLDTRKELDSLQRRAQEAESKVHGFDSEITRMTGDKNLLMQERDRLKAGKLQLEDEVRKEEEAERIK